MSLDNIGRGLVSNWSDSRAQSLIGPTLSQSFASFSDWSASVLRHASFSDWSASSLKHASFSDWSVYKSVANPTCSSRHVNDLLQTDLVLCVFVDISDCRQILYFGEVE